MKPIPRLSSHKASPLKRLLAGAVVIIAIFALDIFSGGIVRAPVRFTVALAGYARTGAGNFFAGSFSTRDALESENRILRDTVARYQADVAAFDIVREENAHLKELVHFSSGARVGMTAPVVSDGSSPYGTILVGIGTVSGISVGDTVLSSDGFAIGRVSDVQAQTAIVSEIFAPGVSLIVTLGDASLTVEGKGGGNGRIQAPRALVIQEGDVAIAPSLGGASVGKVGKVESDPASAYQTVYLRTPTNFSTLRFVYIQKP